MQTVAQVKAFYARCKKRLSRSVGVLEAEKLCGKIVDRKLARAVKKRGAAKKRRRARCAHCGMIGKRTGHMDCQYPQDY